MFVCKLFGRAGKKILTAAFVFGAAWAQSGDDDWARAARHLERAAAGGKNAPLHYFNAAQLALKAGMSDKAGPLYVPILGNQLPADLRSIALNNFAVVKTERDRDTVAALAYLKKALIDDPGNETARYNYELLKSKMPPPPPLPPLHSSDAAHHPMPDNAYSPENTGNPPPPKPLSFDEVEIALRDYRRREAQYIQQLRKRSTFNPYLNQSLW
jgi:tetratricopeptide (TPR) repeat protein